MSADDHVRVAKTTWTEADFELMGWHDAAVHAIAIQPAPPWPGRIVLDLDYIVKWEMPRQPSEPMEFWLCPSTLVFDEASDLVADIDLSGFAVELSIDELQRSDADQHGMRTWTIAGHEFTVQLRSRGFTQYIRSDPVRSSAQRLSAEARGGVSFAERPHR